MATSDLPRCAYIKQIFNGKLENDMIIIMHAFSLFYAIAVIIVAYVCVFYCKQNLEEQFVNMFGRCVEVEVSMRKGAQYDTWTKN